MPQKPTIQGLKLEACCKETLKEIDNKIALGRLLKAMLAAGPFISMLGSNPIDVVFTISTTDWDLLGKATKSVSPIVKNRCRDVALLHSFDHPGGPLNRFWIGMADAFE